MSRKRKLVTTYSRYSRKHLSTKNNRKTVKTHKIHHRNSSKHIGSGIFGNTETKWIDHIGIIDPLNNPAHKKNKDALMKITNYLIYNRKKLTNPNTASTPQLWVGYYLNSPLKPVTQQTRPTTQKNKTIGNPTTLKKSIAKVPNKNGLTANTQPVQNLNGNNQGLQVTGSQVKLSPKKVKLQPKKPVLVVNKPVPVNKQKIIRDIIVPSSQPIRYTILTYVETPHDKEVTIKKYPVIGKKIEYKFKFSFQYQNKKKFIFIVFDYLHLLTSSIFGPELSWQSVRPDYSDRSFPNITINSLKLIL
jgi:hypothetical protein